MVLATKRAASTYALSTSNSCDDNASVKPTDNRRSAVIRHVYGRAFSRTNVAALIERPDKDVYLVDSEASGDNKLSHTSCELSWWSAIVAAGTLGC